MTRIIQIILGIAGLGALTLGLLFWIAKIELISVHMLFGLIVTLTLLVMSVMAVSTRGMRIWGVIGIVYALIVPVFGLTQLNDANFVQPSITIKKGESITLVADTLVGHTISNGTWDNGMPKLVRESGAPLVDNVSVGGNSSVSVGPFVNAGTFKLYCTIHPGMNLTVVVQ